MNAKNGTELSLLDGPLDEQKKDELLQTDPDFIAIKRFSYSLEELLERYPDGVPNHIIAAALLIEEGEVDAMYQDIVQKLRDLMRIDMG